MPEDNNLFEWMLKHKCSENISIEHEPVLIAAVELPDQLTGHCFGIMPKTAADEGGSIITTLHSFPRGVKKTLAYVRLWETPTKKGVHIRPITKIEPLRLPHTQMARTSRLFSNSRGLDIVDIAVLSGKRDTGLIPTEGISDIPEHGSGNIDLLKDVLTDKQYAINLVTGERVHVVGASPQPDGYSTLLALATPFVRAHQGVPYLHADGSISISKGEGTMNMHWDPEKPTPSELKLTITVRLYLTLNR